jgi:hypothetical protein
MENFAVTWEYDYYTMKAGIITTTNGTQEGS